MKRLLTIVFLAITVSTYAFDIELLKQSLVGTWHPSRGYDNDNPYDEDQLNFYLDGNNLMVKYVSDYSWVWGEKNHKTFNKYGICNVKINYDGTIEFSLNRTETGYDKKGNEERKGYGEYSYKLFFVDGLLAGTETWGRRYLLTQPQNNRGLVRFKTIEQAQRRGNVSAFPFGNDPYTTPIDFYNNNETNIKKFYRNGIIDELSNCNPSDYKYGFLLGTWGYNDDGLWDRYGNMDFNIKIFIRNNNYYLRYSAEKYALGIVQIFPQESCGEISFSFDTKQEFIGKCEGYDYPWKYNFKFYVKKHNDERLIGTREWTNVSGPLDACGIPEPQNCNILYYKWK